MLRSLATLGVVASLAVALPAEARFGKSGSSSGSSSSGGSRGSGSSGRAPNSSTEHPARAVNSPRPPSTTNYSNGTRTSVRYGFAPYYGYGYHYGYGRYYGAYPYGYYAYGAPAVVVAPGSAPADGPSMVRVTAGVEGQGYGSGFSAGSSGFTLTAMASIEGEHWGFNASGSNIAVRSECGSCSSFDNIQGLTAHLTFSPLVGEAGRLRIEGGVDTFFAPDAIFIGPTFGLSGVWWVGTPVGIEASAMVTPFPYRQLDVKAGLVVGVGPVGLRAGWRMQVLDDRGLVDGNIHQDIFNGPYAGLSLVF